MKNQRENQKRSKIDTRVVEFIYYIDDLIESIHFSDFSLKKLSLIQTLEYGSFNFISIKKKHDFIWYNGFSPLYHRKTSTATSGKGGLEMCKKTKILFLI